MDSLAKLIGYDRALLYARGRIILEGQVLTGSDDAPRWTSLAEIKAAREATAEGEDVRLFDEPIRYATFAGLATLVAPDLDPPTAPLALREDFPGRADPDTPQRIIECPQCHGEGLAKERDCYCIEDGQAKDDCKRCHGTGRSRGTCGTCGGHGKLADVLHVQVGDQRTALDLALVQAMEGKAWKRGDRGVRDQLRIEMLDHFFVWRQPGGTEVWQRGWSEAYLLGGLTYAGEDGNYGIKQLRQNFVRRFGITAPGEPAQIELAHQAGPLASLAKLMEKVDETGGYLEVRAAEGVMGQGETGWMVVRNTLETDEDGKRRYKHASMSCAYGIDLALMLAVQELED